MKLITIPPLIMAGIAAAVGVYHLFVYDRRREQRENLAFGLLCWVIAYYDVFCAQFYNASTPSQALLWQKLQLASHGPYVIILLWFVTEYTGKKLDRFFWTLSALLGLSTLVVLANPGFFALVETRPLVRTVILPWDLSLVFLEAARGPYFLMEGLVGLAAVGYAMWLAAGLSRTDPARARPLLAALVLLFLGMANDGAVGLGLYNFFYVFEYAFLGMVVLMAFSLAQDVVMGAQMQKSLAESQKQYRLLAENTRDVIWTAGLDLHFTFCSPAVESLTGYTVEEILRVPLYRVLMPHSHQAAVEAFSQRVEAYQENPDQAPGAITLELEYRKKDGAGVWTEVTAAFERDAQGRAVGVVGISRDISQRKRAQDRLEESEAHLRSVFAAAKNVAFITTDLDREEPCILDFSPGAERLLGYKKDQVLGRPAAMLHQPGDWAGLKAAVAFYEDNSDVTREVNLVRSEGKNVPALVTLYPVFDNQGRRVAGLEVALDMAPLRDTQIALKASEEKYKSILESMEEGYYEVDLAGRFTFFNAALCPLLGYSKKDLLGQVYHQFTTPETAGRMHAIFHEVYSTGEPARVSDFEIIYRDGKKRALEMSVSLMRGQDNEATGFKGVVRDVSDRQAAEKERRRLSKRRGQAQKMEALGTLAGGVAHDFNNLLMGMGGNVGLMLLGLEKDHPHFERLKNIDEYVRAASGLTRQLLGFARGGRFEAATVHVNDLVERTSSMYGRTKKEVRIHLDLEPEIWPVQADSGQLEQVLLNLYVNAFHAMPDGGDLFLGTRNLVFEATDARPEEIPAGRYVQISVRDTGVGMDAEVQKKAFDPFFSTKERGRGTGLGLSTAYGIMKSHEGLITVESQKGLGTVFFLYLPATNKKVEKKQENKPALVKGSETLLLIDDEDMILETGRDMLQALGYTVLTAKGGEQGLALYRRQQEKIALVVLDLIMPGMLGGEVFDRIREINPRARVLLCSGYSMHNQAAAILKKGAADFIQKPFNMRQISYTIRGILDA